MDPRKTTSRRNEVQTRFQKRSTAFFRLGDFCGSYDWSTFAGSNRRGDPGRMNRPGRQVELGTIGMGSRAAAWHDATEVAIWDGGFSQDIEREAEYLRRLQQRPSIRIRGVSPHDVLEEGGPSFTSTHPMMANVEATVLASSHATINEKQDSSKSAIVPLTASQIAIVKSTAPAMREHGEAITTLFYRNLLAAHPDLNNIFNQTSQATGDQPRALAQAVFAYATYVDDLDKLKTAVERIAHKHASLTVQPEHYVLVGKHLIEAVATVLGAAVTADVAEAWTAAYALLADIFITREQQLYSAHGAWKGWRAFKIDKKMVESALITSFHLVPADGQLPLPAFRPGQYVSLRVHIPQLGHKQPRQYSMSERPCGDHYRISVKREAGEHPGLPGMVSNLLHSSYQEGDTVELTHPTGDFFVENTEEEETSSTSSLQHPLVLISAGVGITPMMSILNNTLATSGNSKQPISFLHGARDGQSQAFGKEIQKIAESHPNFTATVFRSKEEKGDARRSSKGSDYHFDGRVDLSRVDAKKTLFVDDETARYYVCGPLEFMADVRRFLGDAGVASERVHCEVFGVGN